MCTYTCFCSAHIEADASCKLPTQCSTEHFLAQALLGITHDFAGGLLSYSAAPGDLYHIGFSQKRSCYCRQPAATLRKRDAYRDSE